MARQESADELIKLQSCEGEIFEVPLKVAKISRTLSTMLTDLGHEADDIIPLPNVTSAILKRVIAWAEHSVKEGLDCPPISTLSPITPVTSTSPTPQDQTSTQLPFQPRPQPRVSHRSSSSRRVLPPPGHTLSQWEKEFLSHNRDKVYDLLLAANYLDIKSLLDVLCKAVADMIKGRDPQDIRRVFHASDPSTQDATPIDHAPSLVDWVSTDSQDSLSINSRQNQ